MHLTYQEFTLLTLPLVLVFSILFTIYPKELIRKIFLTIKSFFS